jgi:hypothetical protein
MDGRLTVDETNRELRNYLVQAQLLVDANGPGELRPSIFGSVLKNEQLTDEGGQ